MTHVIIVHERGVVWIHFEHGDCGADACRNESGEEEGDDEHLQSPQGSALDQADIRHVVVYWKKKL